MLIWRMAWNTKTSTVKSVEINIRGEEVWDIEMPEFHNFFADDHMAHNCHEVSWKSVLDKSDNQYAKIINHFQSINPKLAIVGMTGSPYRGIESIKGPFWQKEIEPSIDRKFLVDNGYIVPTIFGYGHDNVQYDLDKFSPENEFGTKDFSSSQMSDMHDAMSISTTQSIMHEVMDKMKDRLCALVTCAGLKHCEEASSVVPSDEMAIITDKTPKKERQEIIRAAKKGELNDRGTFKYKYIFQIGCLTTGVNIPLWCTSVLLRRIGSLTLLTQLLGRGMRLLKTEHEEAGFVKHDHLVLDYSGTMAAMHQMFDDPLLDDAVMDKAKQENAYVTCPICSTINGEYARRCVGVDTIGNEIDGRCGHWWKSRKCEDRVVNGQTISRGCGADNDVTARECRNCHQVLIDPNDKLTHKSYGESDWKPVISMQLEIIGKSQDGIRATYVLDSFDLNGRQEIARVNYWAIKAGGNRAWVSNFVRRHISGYAWQQKVSRFGVTAIIKNKAIFDTPSMITHRLNDKGDSIVNGLRFKSGKTIKGNKVEVA